MNKIIVVFATFFYLYVGSALGQAYKRSNNIPVINQAGERLQTPWAGGMNDAQFHNMDINLDGTPDILVFDGYVGKFTPYIYADTAENPIQFQPRYLANFENCDCQKWIQIADFNCDGQDDIICGSGSVGQHFKVYEGRIFDGDSLGFVQTIDPILGLTLGNNIPVFTISSDIPSVIDVDFDGDLDIVTTQNGFDFWAYYQNLGMERFGRCDTAVFELNTFCWGHFSEGVNDNQLFVADTINCPRGIGPAPIEPRHVGSTILLIDLNADSLFDVLLGDISFPTVNGVMNNGTITDAFMDSAFFKYPATDSAITVEIFPGLYFTDADNDGVKDLISSSHAPTGGENQNGVVFYKNFGANNQPDFRFQNRGFMADQHIDVGQYSTPVFFDHNQDGLPDLLVGSRGFSRKTPTDIEDKYQLQLFENTGSLVRPEFTLVNDDYLGGSTQFLLFESAAMGFGDIDGDGDEDMFMGNTLGKLYFFRNEASPGADADLQLITNNLADADGVPIDIGTLSTPELFDYDNDGDLDLFSGDRFGKVAYFENVGDAQNFAFRKITDQWGGINIRFPITEYEFYGRTKPRFLDYDKDGIVELLLATEGGYVEIYEDIGPALTDTIYSDSILFNANIDRELSLAAAVLDTSGNYTYVFGGERGGLSLYNTVDIAAEPDSNVMGFPDLTQNLPFRLAPNPAKERVRVLFDADAYQFSEKKISLINAIGQEIYRTGSKGSQVELDLTAWPAGLYYVKVSIQGENWVAKLVHSL